jgi:hypothetical protein
VTGSEEAAVAGGFFFDRARGMCAIGTKRQLSRALEYPLSAEDWTSCAVPLMPVSRIAVPATSFAATEVSQSPAALIL